MSKVSYQDIETRLGRVEEKLDFTMKAFAVQRKTKTYPERIEVVTLLDVFREITREGEGVVLKSDLVKEGEIIDTIEQSAGDEVV